MKIKPRVREYYARETLSLSVLSTRDIHALGKLTQCKIQRMQLGTQDTIKENLGVQFLCPSSEANFHFIRSDPTSYISGSKTTLNTKQAAGKAGERDV